MDINMILTAVLLAVFAVVGVALAILLFEAYKMVKDLRVTLADVKVHLDPMMADAEEMTSNIKPVTAKVEPIVDRVQLTLDSVNLEMLRLDGILADVGKMTNAASSATEAVDNITNAPIKAVNNVATRIRTKFGTKSASDESIYQDSDPDAVDEALADFMAAEAKDAGTTAETRSEDARAAMDSLEKEPAAPIEEEAAAPGVATTAPFPKVPVPPKQ